jgi:Ca2+-binding RTX toxin-like protein
MAASSLTLAAPVLAVELTCLGKTATVAQHRGTIVGTPGDDVIVLTGRGRVIAGDGNDLVCGSPGADVIFGGPGNDVVLSGDGNDSVSGGPGIDQLHGEAGDDSLIGGPGSDQIFGATGTDKVIGGPGPDSVSQDGTVVLITANSMDVQMMQQTGVNFAVAAGSRAGAQVVWASASPMQSMALVLGPDLAAFAAESSSTRIVSNGVAPVGLGQSVVLGIDNTLSTSGSGTAGTVNLVNNSASVSLMGLLSRVIVNGSTSLGPVSATQLAPGTRRAMNAPTSAVLFTSARRANDFIDSLPAQAIDIDLTSGRTASFVYDGGSFKRS